MRRGRSFWVVSSSDWDEAPLALKSSAGYEIWYGDEDEGGWELPTRFDVKDSLTVSSSSKDYLCSLSWWLVGLIVDLISNNTTRLRRKEQQQSEIETCNLHVDWDSEEVSRPRPFANCGLRKFIGVFSSSFSSLFFEKFGRSREPPQSRCGHCRLKQN